MLPYSSHDDGQLLQAILHSVIDGIITIDVLGVIQTVNPAAEHLFGYASEEMLGKNVNMLMPEPYHHEHDGYLRHFLSTGEAKIIGIGREVEGKRKDGQTFPMELGVSEFTLAGERMFVGIVRDISERKQDEQDREMMINTLSESNEELERFAYVASHDLQEPLRMISSYSELLKKRYGDALDETATRYVDYCYDAARQMQALVNDLLEYARLGKEAEKEDEIEVQQVLAYVEHNLKESIDESCATIISSQDLPTIKTNPVRFSRLLQNLMGNAIKYCKKDVPPKIEISFEDKGDVLCFCLADNGIGMRQEYTEKIFLPFKRLHGKGEYSGTGIGLSICKKIVENFGGTIWAESEPGIGSRFYFTVPKNT